MSMSYSFVRRDKQTDELAPGKSAAGTTLSRRFQSQMS